MKKNETRTRFGPSPTGAMHIGNLRTALYAFLLARKNDGKFIVRIEDTDRERHEKGSIKKIIDALQWVGIEIDEGVYYDKNGKVVEKGECGPYFQSKRLDIYKKYIDVLIEKSYAYHCFLF